MVAASFETSAARNSGNIRKALKGLVALGPYETTDLIATVAATGGQINLPTGVKSVGWLTSDGATEGNESETAAITGWGSATALRTDLTEVSATLGVAFLEDNRLTREVYDSVDLSGVEADPTTGEVQYDLEAQPDIKYWRGVVISVDGTGPTRRYWGTVYHKLNVTERTEFTSANGDEAATRGVTLTASPDDETGTLGYRFEFGPGFLARAVEEGWIIGS